MSDNRAANSGTIPFTVESIAWTDVSLGDVPTPRGTMQVTLGVGSGLSRRFSDPPGTIWAVTDRGPNFKIAAAINMFGLDHLEALKDLAGAKVMPRPDIGPVICELRLDGDRMELVRTLPLLDDYGRAINGLPIPLKNSENIEPVFDMSGSSLPPDPDGADTEAIAAHSDGSFWIADEYAPSLIKVDSEGRIITRWAPRDFADAFSNAHYPVSCVLPQIATRRRINRGFEAIALSSDEMSLFAAFQSSLDRPETDPPSSTAYARIWKLDSKSGAVLQQFIYPFDAPESFLRDREAGTAAAIDLKLSEIQAIGSNRLLVLERITHTAKIYSVDLDDTFATPDSHLEDGAALTIEQLGDRELADQNIRPLRKTLIFSTDDAPQIYRDLEGMIILSPRELLLVNDNDFGVEGARTRFWRVQLERDL